MFLSRSSWNRWELMFILLNLRGWVDWIFIRSDFLFEKTNLLLLTFNYFPQIITLLLRYWLFGLEIFFLDIRRFVAINHGLNDFRIKIRLLLVRILNQKKRIWYCLSEQIFFLFQRLLRKLCKYWIFWGQK